MTIIDNSRFRQCVYELVENDDSIVESPKGIALVDALASGFLNGMLSIYFDPESNSLLWKSVEVEAWELSDLGVSLEKAGLVDKSISVLKRALELNPKDGKTRTNLGHAYYDKGLIDEAIEEYERALELDPNLEFAYDGLGSAYARKGLGNKAITMFKQAVDLDPNSALPHRNLGRAYSDKGLIDEAIEEYERALELDPNNASVRNDLGIAYLRKRLWHKATAEFRRALQLDPNLDLAQKNLEIAQNKETLKTPAKMLNPEAYELIAHFENTLRSFIQDKMEKTIGKKWWRQKIPADVREKCEVRKREEREEHPWMEVKDLHPIYYADFLDYMKIMTKRDNWRQIFSRHFKDAVWIEARMKELNLLRNKVAHNRELAIEDLWKLKIFTRETLRCLER